MEDAELKLSYEEAYELVLKGLAPLGEHYAQLLKKGRDERWIDVMERQLSYPRAFFMKISLRTLP